MRAAVCLSRGTRLLGELLDCPAGCVRTHVQCRNRHANAIHDRRCHRAQTLLELLVYQGPALPAHLLDLAQQFLRIGDGLGRMARQRRNLAEQALDLVVGQACQQNAAHRGGECGQARTDPQVDRHDAGGGGDPRHIHDIGAVEHRDGAGLVNLLDQFDHVRLSQLPEGLRVQVGEPEVEHARAQREVLAVEAGVPELDQGQQQPPRRAARQARLSGDIAERHRRGARIEGFDDREPLRERPHKIAARFALRIGNVAVFHDSALLLHRGIPHFGRAAQRQTG